MNDKPKGSRSPEGGVHLTQQQFDTVMHYVEWSRNVLHLVVEDPKRPDRVRLAVASGREASDAMYQGLCAVSEQTRVIREHKLPDSTTFRSDLVLSRVAEKASEKEWIQRWSTPESEPVESIFARLQGLLAKRRVKP